MANVDAARVFVQEGAYSFTNTHLHFLLQEIDARLNCAQVFDTITYTSGLISKIEIFSDSLRTVKVIERTYTRSIGSDGVEYIDGFVTKFYNADTSEDSRVTTTLVRDVTDKITSSDNVFSTSESNNP